MVNIIFNKGYIIINNKYNYNINLYIINHIDDYLINKKLILKNAKKYNNIKKGCYY